jgi:hypothetical protein
VPITTSPRKRLLVTPPDCLIPWTYVITIQALAQFKDLKVTGFKNCRGMARARPSSSCMASGRGASRM